MFSWIDTRDFTNCTCGVCIPSGGIGTLRVFNLSNRSCISRVFFLSGKDWMLSLTLWWGEWFVGVQGMPGQVKGSCPGFRGPLESVIDEVVVLSVLSTSCILALAFVGSPTPLTTLKSTSAVEGKTVEVPDIEEGVLGPDNDPLVGMHPYLFHSVGSLF